MSSLGLRLVPDELWEPLVPRYPEQRQGRRDGTVGRPGGVHRDRVRADQRLCVAASADRVRVSSSTAHRRFMFWTEQGLWLRLHRAVLDELGRLGLVDWSNAIVDAASVRAKKRVR